MSANAFNPVYPHQGRRSLLRRHSIDCPIPNEHPFFLKPRAAAAVRSHLQSSFPPAAAFAVSSAAYSTSTSEQGVGVNSFDVLRQHLSSGDFRQADEETRRLLIVLAGEAAEKRGYVFFSEVQFISAEDLRTIDALWREHSGGRFGYSVQKRIWEKSNRDFTKFFIKVGWMRRLEGSEVEQYNYRSFPAEFMWEMGETPPPPEGHLPLTNALRGTQLLGSILRHPAFAESENEKEEETKMGKEVMGSEGFKPNYSF